MAARRLKNVRVESTKGLIVQIVEQFQKNFQHKIVEHNSLIVSSSTIDNVIKKF